MAKNASKLIEGEKLCVLFGSVPYAGEGSDRVKLAVLSLLNDKYGLTEADLISAELEVVPAFPVREIGIDRSLIGGYGQDDRVCAFAELKAILDTEAPDRTAVCILADKEEIGSYGVTGMQSQAFERFMEKLIGGICSVQACFSRSFCVSADVTAAMDPLYAEVSEKQNAARINYGVGFCKYTGARGKSGASDASAELVGYLRRLCDENGVSWQMCELGKVDQGGGGTVAMFMAQRDIDTIDAGVPVLSMHAPFETTAKFDCYMTYKCMKVAYNAP
jgi:aspartyl aminopeptidase